MRDTNGTLQTEVRRQKGQGKEKAMKTLREKLGALPASRRKKIAKRTTVRIAEEMTMRQLVSYAAPCAATD
jgi:hypothetical protein